MELNARPGRASRQRARHGVDIAREQLRLGVGERLFSTGRAPRRGHALEIRLNAEDPARGRTGAGNDRALPAAARPRHPDRHAPGAGIDDSPTTTLIAKLIVWAEDRLAAIARSIRALQELELDGVPTTQALALDILRSPEFAGGDHRRAFLEEMVGSLPALTAAEAAS